MAVAEEGRQGEVRYFGEINADVASVRKLVCGWRSVTLSFISATKRGRQVTGFTDKLLGLGRMQRGDALSHSPQARGSDQDQSASRVTIGPPASGW